MTVAFVAFIIGGMAGIVGTLALVMAISYITEKTAIDTGEIELNGEWYAITKREDGAEE